MRCKHLRRGWKSDWEQVRCGDGGGDSTSLQVASLLEGFLIVTPESHGDYVQFNLPDQAWSSNNMGGDPRAHGIEGDQGEGWGTLTRLITCTFACGWSGAVIQLQ